jgi:hypothetical protein
LPATGAPVAVDDAELFGVEFEVEVDVAAGRVNSGDQAFVVVVTGDEVVDEP